MNHKDSWLVAGLCVMLLAACSGVATPSGASNEGTPSGTEESSGDATVLAGELDQAGLIGALEEAGFEVETGDPIEHPFFTIKGQIIHLNGADVQVFEYDSAEDAQTQAGLIAPDGGSIGTSMVTWIDTPHFFQSGRLIVLVLGNDQAVLDAFTGVLGEQIAGG